MIIKTRYRDIPHEEAFKCAGPGSRRDVKFWEQECRGKAIAIVTPPRDETNNRNVGCGGPWYARADDPMGLVIVCPHIAEIGD